MVRILLLEDDDSLRELLAAVLMDNGYQVEAAATGDEAVRVAQSQEFDLVVTDVRMPGLDGLQALELVQRQQPGVPSMVVTGFSSEADSIRAIRLGVGDYLKKPFSVETFLSAVHRLISQRQRENQLLSREAAVGQTVVWALETVVNSIELADDADGGPSATELARTARRAAEALGLPGPACDEVQLAVLLGRIGEPGIPSFMSRAVPPGVHHLLKEVREDPGNCSASAQLVRTFLEPDRVPADAAVAAAVQAATSGAATEGAREATSRARSLLSLARALEDSGDGQSASDAYARVVDTGHLGSELVEAQLGAARVALQRGHAEGAREWLHRARSSARLLGPEATLRASIETATLQARSDPSEAMRELGASQELGRRFGLTDAVAHATLLQAALSGHPLPDPGPVLSEALKPQRVHELQSSVAVLLPWLFQRHLAEPREATERALRFLTRQFSREVYAMVLQDRLPPEARASLAPILLSTPGGWAEECLKRLREDPDPSVRAAASRSHGAVEPPLLRIHSFGAFEVFVGDARVDERDFKGKKIRYLLACLASRRGRPVHDDALIEAFYPEDAHKAKMANLYAAASYLRSALRKPGQPEVNYILRTENGFQLNPSCPRWHDMEEFEAEEARARAHKAQGQADALVACQLRMVRLYRGPYLEGCMMDWATHLRLRLERVMLETLAGVTTATLTQGQPEIAREVALRLLEMDPLHQEAHRVVVEALVAMGRPEEALKHFQGCTRLLKRELGLEPSIELIRAQQLAQIKLSVP
ncbi:MAG: response regulator [Candidatus Eremiobacterota bacterium]